MKAAFERQKQQQQHRNTMEFTATENIAHDKHSARNFYLCDDRIECNMCVSNIHKNRVNEVKCSMEHSLSAIYTILLMAE